MKHKYLDQSIPQDSHRKLDNKTLYFIDNGLVESSGITYEDIYNARAGDGGLHSLCYPGHDNYSEYSSVEKEIENG